MAQRSMPSPVQEIYLWIVPLKGLSGPEDYFQKVAIEKSHMLDHEGFQIFLHWAIEVNRTIYEVSRSESPRKSSLSHPSGDYDISISPLSPWLSKREKSLTKRIKCGVTENSDSELNDIAHCIWKYLNHGKYGLTSQNCQDFAHAFQTLIQAGSSPTTAFPIRLSHQSRRIRYTMAVWGTTAFVATAGAALHLGATPDVMFTAGACGATKAIDLAAKMERSPILDGKDDRWLDRMREAMERRKPGQGYEEIFEEVSKQKCESQSSQLNLRHVGGEAHIWEWKDTKEELEQCTKVELAKGTVVEVKALGIQ